MALSASFVHFFYCFVGVDCSSCLVDHVIQLSTTALPTKFLLGSIILLRCFLRGRICRGSAGGSLKIGRMIAMVGAERWALCDDSGIVGAGVSGGFMAFG